MLNYKKLITLLLLASIISSKTKSKNDNLFDLDTVDAALETGE